MKRNPNVSLQLQEILQACARFKIQGKTFFFFLTVYDKISHRGHDYGCHSVNTDMHIHSYIHYFEEMHY